MTINDPNLKAAVDKVEGLIAAERQATDDKIAELKKTGATSPETTAKIEKIEKDVGDAIKAMNDQAKALARITIGGGGGDPKDAAAKAAKATHFLHAKGALKRGQAVTEELMASVAAYGEAFDKFMLDGGTRGETLTPEVRAAMSVGSDADGGFLAHAEILSTFQTRLFETSDMRAVATVRSTTRGSIEFPVDVNKGTSGGWVKEKQARTETSTPQLGMQAIETHEQYAEPAITQTLLDDAAYDVAGWLADKTAEEMSRQENTAFVTGNGVNKPRGFLDYASGAVTTNDATRAWGAMQYIPVGAAGAFPVASAGYGNADALITAISKLKPQFRTSARWFMNRATEATVRKLKDAEGRYLVGFGDLRDNALGFTLLGYPIVNLEDMPDPAADTYSIAFGDMRRTYTIVDRIGFRVLRDPYTSKPFVKFYTTKRVGGDVTDFDALKLIKFAAS